MKIVSEVQTVGSVAETYYFCGECGVRLQVLTNTALGHPDKSGFVNNMRCSHQNKKAIKPSVECRELGELEIP